MAAGLTVTKSDSDSAAGAIARDLLRDKDRFENFKAWLDARTDAQLGALGYSNGAPDPADNDIATLRSAYGNAATIIDSAQLTFLKRLAGLGNV